MEIINVTDEIIEINVTEEVINIQAPTGAYPLPNAVNSVFGRVGNVVGQAGDYTTSLVGEGTNLYYTNARSRAAISETITGINYDSASGIFSMASGYAIATTASQANWDAAYNDKINSASVTGTSTKTLTLNQQDGGTITASWSDADTGLTSVGLSMPAAFSVSGSPLTSNGTIAVTGSGTTLEYVRGDGSLATFPSLTGFVPYTGATANLDLGTFDLTTDIVNLNQLKAVGSGGINIYSNSGTHIALMGGGGGAGTTLYGGLIGTSASFASSGSSDTFAINHSSGSGIALNITKGGSGEGLYINKTSGSGNAATIIGTLNATTLVKTGGTASQFLKADGSVDSNTYATTTALAGYLPLSGGTLTGALSGTSATFSGNLLVGPTTSGFDSVSQIASSSTGNIISALTLQNTSLTETAGTGVNLNFGGRLNWLGRISTQFVGTTGGGDASMSFLTPSGGTLAARLTIASTGAATFSSSVTATTLTLSTTTADYAATITNVQDSSQGLLVRSTDNDGSLYLLNLQSSNGATSQTWVDRFAVTKQGNVGIGTISPNTKLEVKGNIRLDSRSKADSGEVDSITFTKDRPDASTGTYEMGAIRSFTYGGYAGGLTFYSGRHTGNGNYGLVSVMTIGSISDIGLANVGIGTTSPTSNLHITTNSGLLTQDILTVQGGGSPSGNFGFSVKANNGEKIFYTDNLTYNVYANTASGKFGIGTTNPKTRLQVTPASNAEVPVLGTATGVATFTSANGNYGIQFNSTSDGSFHIQSQRFDASATAYSLILNYAGGNVGIGTVPSYKLHVNGTNGSIAISGSGYTLNPIPMLIGQYTSTRGYIQVPDQGSIEMWNGGSSIIAEFKNNSNSIFYGSVGIGTATPLGKLSTIGGAVQIMGDYRNHQTIIKSAGTSGTLSGSLLITIPQMSDGNVDGYGGYSCEVYVAGYPGLFCHAWFSGYVNGGLTNSEATILRSSGGWSISQTSFGANNQGFQFTIDYPSYIVHPTARIIFNKGGSPNSAEYPANQITAVFS
jgi:hypothetical protein